jgi:Zn finger protein HypA/HybF involved in hydrogenase expression
MSEISGQSGLRGAATAVVHESYSFACMRCGHGWEQSYEIEHHNDAEGHEFVMYVAEGQVVPSPLSKPTCQNCDSHVVRIMRPGQVSSVRDAVHKQQRRTPQSEAQEPAAEGAGGAEAGGRDHHWHLSDLLHPFHRKAS